MNRGDKTQRIALRFGRNRQNGAHKERDRPVHRTADDSRMGY